VLPLTIGVIQPKGNLNLRQAPNLRTIFQLVGKRWSLKPRAEWNKGQPIAHLVMIGFPGSMEPAVIGKMFAWIKSDKYLVRTEQRVDFSG
jgi:hypothetical protein